MRKSICLIGLIVAALVLIPACDENEKSLNMDGQYSNDGMTGIPFEGVDNTSENYSFKAGHITLIDFDDLAGPSVPTDHYAAQGVHVYASNGLAMPAYSPCNGSVSIRTMPFTGPHIYFNFDLTIKSCSIEAGDFGADQDVITLTAYSGLHAGGILLGTTTQTLAADFYGCLTLELNDLAGARSIVVTSGDPYPNSIYLDNLLFEDVIIVDLDIKPGSSPNAINCKNDNRIIPVAILTTPEFDALTIDETTVMFEGAADCHPNKPRSDREEDVDLDGDLDLVFHFKLADTALDCNSTTGEITGMTYDGIPILGHDEVTMK